MIVDFSIYMIMQNAKEAIRMRNGEIADRNKEIALTFQSASCDVRNGAKWVKEK